MLVFSGALCVPVLLLPANWQPDRSHRCYSVVPNFDSFFSRCSVHGVWEKKNSCRAFLSVAEEDKEEPLDVKQGMGALIRDAGPALAGHAPCGVRQQCLQTSHRSFMNSLGRWSSSSSLAFVHHLAKSMEPIVLCSSPSHAHHRFDHER
jgi:hypothetical protein